VIINLSDPQRKFSYEGEDVSQIRMLILIFVYLFGRISLYFDVQNADASEILKREFDSNEVMKREMDGMANEYGNDRVIDTDLESGNIRGKPVKDELAGVKDAVSRTDLIVVGEGGVQEQKVMKKETRGGGGGKGDEEAGKMYRVKRVVTKEIKKPSRLFLRDLLIFYNDCGLGVSSSWYPIQPFPYNRNSLLLSAISNKSVCFLLLIFC
jgi:hypothetical protein